MITPEEYTRVLKNYDDALNPIGRVMKKLEAGNKNEIGLLNSRVKNDPVYVELRKQFNYLFDRRKKFCSLVPNNIKSQASQLRRQEKINKNSKS